MVMLCFPKMRLMVVMLTWFMLLNTCLSASIFCRSWWRRMALSALTRSTTASSCCCVNRRWRSSPRRSSSHSRRNTTTYCHRFAYFLTVLYCIYCIIHCTTLYFNLSNHGMFHKNYHFGCKRSISTLQYPVHLIW